MSQLRILETSDQQRRYRLLQFLSHTCVHTMFLQNITTARFFLFLAPVRCGDNLRAASIEIGMHACMHNIKFVSVANECTVIGDDFDDSEL